MDRDLKFYTGFTLVDVTATGVTRYRAEQELERNQQRNWETITQILSLRTQLFGLTEPIMDTTGTRWMFEFETDRDGVFGSNADPTEILRVDAEGVPMLVNLNNSDIDTYLWYGETANYLKTGHFGTQVEDGKDINFLRNGRQGREIRAEEHPKVSNLGR